MSDAVWGLFGLAGLAVVLAANLLRVRRTNGAATWDRFFLRAHEASPAELVANRFGLAMFLVGTTLSIAL